MKDFYLKIKSFFLSFVFILSATNLFSQVPLNSTDVMLQGFYWNSFSETRWNQLTQQAEELSSYFDMLWLPPSAAAEGGNYNNMGYHPLQWSNQNSTWGTEEELKTLINSLKAGG
ncbi:MAG: alpha-amylase, partial [Candidatus Azobacteroides sp.]|nr:alpha-amylase [Candidatus Azobacteroides sp.]